jgi:trk system potassium uptake protein TrkA
MARRRRVLVIGLGRFGDAVARTLAEAGHEVLAVDGDARIVQEISPHVTHAVQADATDVEALEELGARHFETGIVAVGGDIGPSILVTVHLKRLGVPYIIARAHSALHGEILTKVGADRLVFPEQETGARVAHSIAVPNEVDYLPVGAEYGISKVKPPAEFVGQAIDALQFEARYGGKLLMIERRAQVLLHPRTGDTVQADDLLVIAAPDEAMEQWRH